MIERTYNCGCRRPLWASVVSKVAFDSHLSRLVTPSLDLQLVLWLERRAATHCTCRRYNLGRGEQ